MLAALSVGACALLPPAGDGNYSVVVENGTEAPVYLRIDEATYRINPGERALVPVDR